jgi:hypothetical protein
MNFVPSPAKRGRLGWGPHGAHLLHISLSFPPPPQPSPQAEEGDSLRFDKAEIPRLRLGMTRYA